MKITAEPRSDQLNADDLIGGPQTVTITAVKPGSAEQKYDLEIAEAPGRAWRPPLTVLRILMAAWGDESQNWIGKRATLYRDDTVTFGPEAVGGIRVSHLSGLPDGKPLEVRVTTKRGRRGLVKIQPLPDAPAPAAQPTEPTAEDVAACNDVAVLRGWWTASSPERQEQIKARVAEINAEAP